MGARCLSSLSPARAATRLPWDSDDRAVETEPPGDEERVWLRILLSPGYADPAANPYLRLLYGQLADSGIELERFSARALLKRHDIVHVNWPEFLVRWGNPWLAPYDVVKIMVLLRWARHRGAAIVWTAHNLEPHELPRPRLWRLYFSWFLASLDLVVAMGPGAVELLLRRYPKLASVPAVVVPHGHYRGAYPGGSDESAAAMRSSLGIGEDERRLVLLSFGLIRKYKNVSGLARAWRDLPFPRPHMVVAGAPTDPDTERSIRAAVGNEPDAHLLLRYIADDEVAALFDICDVVVVPYETRSALNSGVAMLALSFRRPVVLTDTPASRDLQLCMGVEWVHLCDGSPQDALRVALAAARQPRSESPDLDTLVWSALLSRTVDAYRLAVRTRQLRDLPPAGPRDSVEPALVVTPYEVEQ
jgi:beta-1,4-mannosyltransferase